MFVRCGIVIKFIEFGLFINDVVVASQSTSRAYSFPVTLSLTWALVSNANECSTSSSESPEVPEAFFVNLIFSLYVDMFCHCVKSYDTCYTSVPVRSFPCLSYYRNERYALVGRIENRWRAAGILPCVQSSWLSDFRALYWIAQVSSKLRKATLNSLNVCCFSLWVVTTTTTCILLMTGKSFSTITIWKGYSSRFHRIT